MTLAVLAFMLGIALALYMTPVLRRAALQLGIVDRPDGRLKTHREPVAYLGGLAVFFAFLSALGPTFAFDQSVLGILLSATLVLLIGLIDDFGALSPVEKLAGQALAVAVLLKAGVFVKIVFLPTWLALGISVLWLMTMVNALNIIDIMDGLAAGVAAIAALFLAAAAVLEGDPMVAVLSAALAGSLFGFLRFNFHPARIFLGDAGSLFVGFTLGALAMNGSYTARNPVGLLAPVLILGVPLFDLAFVMVVRRLRGLSPFRGSPDHFALRLRGRGLSVRGTVAVAYAAGVALGGVALAVMRSNSTSAAAILVTAAGVVALIAAVWLGRKEPA